MVDRTQIFMFSEFTVHMEHTAISNRLIYYDHNGGGKDEEKI